MNKKLSFKLLGLGLTMAIATANAFVPINFFKSYDVNLRHHDAPKGNPFRFGVNLEYGQGHDGRNWDSKKANILQTYEATQAVIPMLINGKNADITAAYNHLLVGGAALDDGTRGHVALTGKLSALETQLHARYELPISQIPGKLSIGLALPVRHANVSDITFKDNTQTLAPADAPIRDRYTTSLEMLNTKITELGGADLKPWSRTGLGDLVFMVDWNNNYPQEKEGLKNVQLHAKVGVSMPTGVERDIKHAFSMPFGNDGAWGMPFGLGLNLDFNYHIRLGAEAQFDVVFDESKERYMKTDTRQTAFLLLNKGEATMDHGLTWQFNLFLQGYQFWKGLSLKFGYEYLKHDDDRLTPKADTFNASVANSAAWLHEYNLHNLIFQGSWDAAGCCEDWGVKPQLVVFYKLPVGGKNIAAFQTFGGQLAICF